MLFMLGESFWTACVAFSVASGATVEQIVTKALYASGTVLGAFPDDHTKYNRGCAYYGRSVDVVSDLIRSIHCRAYTESGVLYVVEKGQGQKTITLDDTNVTEEPTTMNGIITVETDVFGFMVGQLAQLNYNELTGLFRIMAVTIDADSEGSAWHCTLTLLDENSIDLIDWEGIG